MYGDTNNISLSKLHTMLINEKLTTVNILGVEKKYVEAKDVWVNNSFLFIKDAFGIYQNSKGEYCLFITDESGSPNLVLRFRSEGKACTYLYEKLLSLKEA